MIQYMHNGSIMSLLYHRIAAAISFLCWTVFDQYVITSRNAGFRNRCSSVRVSRWTVVYLSIIFVSGIVNGVCVLQNGTFTLFNTYFLTPFVYSVGTLIIMTVCTLGTIRNLRSVRSFSQQGVSRVPFGFQGIYLEFTKEIHKDSFRLALEYFFDQMILLLFHCNYVCTFYIYLYMSSEVRRIFKDLIFKYIRHNNIVTIRATAHNEVHCRILNMAQDSSHKEVVITAYASDSIDTTDV
ncbi:unnamed protein product [Adineta steineri]|uniref:Uncharacterized protein n=1 Tax=Adineta steineri TaxID=433720 RepID=A0A814G9V5_9BILA|nr:unnamed protein product [Adineta steineri]CAF3691241.1 unnamed protein product [Adineta steineri]